MYTVELEHDVWDKLWRREKQSYNAVMFTNFHLKSGYHKVVTRCSGGTLLLLGNAEHKFKDFRISQAAIKVFKTIYFVYVKYESWSLVLSLKNNVRCRVTPNNHLKHFIFRKYG
jgi:hypothetical protein